MLKERLLDRYSVGIFLLVMCNLGCATLILLAGDIWGWPTGVKLLPYHQGLAWDYSIQGLTWTNTIEIWGSLGMGWLEATYAFPVAVWLMGNERYRRTAMGFWVSAMIVFGLNGFWQTFYHIFLAIRILFHG